jgi:hypothetical protein
MEQTRQQRRAVEREAAKPEPYRQRKRGQLPNTRAELRKFLADLGYERLTGPPNMTLQEIHIMAIAMYEKACARDLARHREGARRVSANASSRSVQ